MPEKVDAKIPKLCEHHNGVVIAARALTTRCNKTVEFRERTGNRIRYVCQDHRNILADSLLPIPFDFWKTIYG